MKCDKKDVIDVDKGGGDPIYRRENPFEKSNSKNISLKEVGCNEEEKRVLCTGHNSRIDIILIGTGNNCSLPTCYA
jgi:hypothetical protein